MMTLDAIVKVVLKDAGLFTQTSMSAWVAVQDARGKEIKLYREYIDGKHRNSLSPEMKNMLRLELYEGVLDQFNLNYMDIIVQTMVDRLEVTRLEATVEGDAKAAKEAGQQWIDAVGEDNRFDGLQGDVHEACARDGETYLMEYWDNQAKAVRWSHELAWDGTSGIVPYYETSADQKPRCVLKIWHIGVETETDPNAPFNATVPFLPTFDTETFVNVYWEDRVERWHSSGSGLEHFDVLPSENDPGQAWNAPWKTIDGKPVGLPIIPFHNRKSGTHGRSELKNAIPIQDTINRTLYSLIITSELTGFGINIAKGFEPPASITPGMWVKMGPLAADGVTITPPENSEEAAALNAMQATRIQPAELAPYLETLTKLVGEMGKITRTPAPEFMGGDAASGEALKQRETPLIGKVKRAFKKLGNSWEDAATLSGRIQQAFGDKQPPTVKRYRAIWKDPEIRNDTAVVDNAKKVADHVGQREFLRMIAPVYGWDDVKIQQIIDEKNADDAAHLARLGGVLPNFNSFAGV